MYVPFFGLQHAPFSIAPDPRYLFMSERHREALAHLLYGLDAGGGFVLLTGDVGTGKTTVCRCFLEQVPAHCNVAYIFNPKLSALELLKTVCDEFRIAPPAAGGSSVSPTLRSTSRTVARKPVSIGATEAARSAMSAWRTSGRSKNLRPPSTDAATPTPANAVSRAADCACAR